MMIFKKNLLAASLLMLPLSAMAFYDAAPPAEKGVTVIQFLQQYDSDKIKGNDGKTINLPAADISTFIPMTQLVYYPQKHQLFDMDIAYTAFFPYQMSAETDLGKADNGLGDIKLSVYLQSGGLAKPDHPTTYQRFELFTWVPVGDYDENNALNPGTNYYQAAFQYTFTRWLAPRWTVSSVANYTWNAKNTNPLVSSGAKNNTQEGAKVNVVLDSAYQVTDRLSLGLTSYYTKQMSADKRDGRSVENSKEEVFAFGPGFIYLFTPVNVLATNLWFEQDAKNRAEGRLLMVRLTHHF